ncbi:MAG: hypothetical protein ACI39Q_09105 [Wujia sp.]
MYRVINKYLENVNLQANNEIYMLLKNVLADISEIKKYTVSVSVKHFVVDIKLNAFSVEKAAEVFNMFNTQIAYPYSEMHVRFNEGKCVRYRYVTSKENKEGFYCDICIS